MKFLRRSYKKITNFISWVPIIWNDQHYDHFHIFNILRHKTKLVIKQFETEKHWRYVGIENDIEDMKKFYNALDRICKDDYEDLPEYLESKDYMDNNEFADVNPIMSDYWKELVKKNLEHIYKQEEDDLLIVSDTFKNKINAWWL